jgi:hypothetical protein
MTRFLVVDATCIPDKVLKKGQGVLCFTSELEGSRGIYGSTFIFLESILDLRE